MSRWIPHLLMLFVLLAIRNSATSAPETGQSPEQAARLLKSNRFSELNQYLAGRQSEYDSGAITEEELRNTFRAFYSTEASLAPAYDRWVREFPRSYTARLARAIYRERVANEKRGGAYIDQTSDEQLRGFEEGLRGAKEDLDISLQLEVRPILSYVHQIDIAGSLAAPDRGRSFLDLALKLDPDTFIPRARYMYNLQTRWGGSLDLMRAFFQECQAARVSGSHLHLLESILREEEGWVHLHYDEDADAARESYQRAAALDPELCLVCFKRELSDLLVKQRKYGEAAGVLSDILHSDPTNTKVLLSRGWVYMDLERAGEAVADWTRAAELGDSNAQNEVGRVNMTGIPGVLQPNRRVGMEWFRKSAAQGNAAGIQNLAVATAQSGSDTEQ